MLKLVCIEDFHGHKKGMEITDPVIVAKHLDERPHHFVKVWAPEPEPEVAPAPASETTEH